MLPVPSPNRALGETALQFDAGGDRYGGAVGVRFAWLFQPLPVRNEELIAVNLVAVMMSIVFWNGVALTSALRYPLSRRSLA
ncbi:MAG: hypothetical protein FJ293_00565 [Planctomycetes bacterium]|nr:hypothetical protein [Planctomycetota bacterium]